MSLIQILDSDYNGLGYLSNNGDEALNFYNDELKTTIDGGVYTFSFTVDKDSPQNKYIKEGNFLTLKTIHGNAILLTIMAVDEDRYSKHVYCEDASLNLINKVVGAQTNENETKKNLAAYVNPMLQDTGWKIKKDESDTMLALEFTGTETLLRRIKKLAEEFGVEFYFSTETDSKGGADFFINFVKRRTEGRDKFHLTSEHQIAGLKRKVNVDNIVTKLHITAKPKDSSGGGIDSSVSGYSPEQLGAPSSGGSAARTQSNASRYDSSKQSAASPSPISISGYSAGWVNQFYIDQADPPYVNGAYIDNFLRRGYPDSPLIGHGDHIKKAADYWGISVGAFMGQIAKETVFGRSSCGGRYNFGCIRWVSGSKFSNRNGWIDPPSIQAGINSYFDLARRVYVNQGQYRYDAYLNKYSPSFENDQTSFKQLMYGVLKSFGYDTSDNTRKKNYSSASDNPITVSLSGGSTSSSGGGASKSVYDEKIDKLIDWFQQRKGRVGYSMNARQGPNYYDCSSAVYSALRYAGIPTKYSGLGATPHLWEDVGTLMTQIPNNQARRGDIFLSGAKGWAGAGAAAHTGVYTSPNRIIHCNYSDNGITETPVAGRSGTPLYSFRIINKWSGQSSSSGSSGGTSSKTEKAVQRALAQVGGRYVWGGVAYRANDCSGLVYESYRHAGFPINHRCTTATIAAQSYPFKRISASEARRGDLVIQHGGGHVAILLGSPSSGAGIVHAANTSLGIIQQKSITNVNGYYRVMGG